MLEPDPSTSTIKSAKLAGLEQRLLRRLRELGLPTGSRMLIGFSGGGDSLALVAVLRRVAGLGRIDLVAAHVDHGLRANSASEQDEVAAAAATLDVPFRGGRIEADRLTRHTGVGIEEAARRERYLILAQLAAEENAKVVALAHHQADQAETVLLHLLRGAGLAGASGMAVVSELVVPWWEKADEPSYCLRLWRPFLDEPREVIRRYAAGLPVRPVDDPSNLDCDIRRNAIRHRVLPLLEAIQPGATAALARYAKVAAADDACLEDMIERIEQSTGQNGEFLPRAILVHQPLALQRRLIRHWLMALAGQTEVSAERVEAVRWLAVHGHGGKVVQIGDGYTVTLASGMLRAARPAERAGEVRDLGTSAR